MADRSFTGVWKSGKQRTLPTFPHPLLRRRADIYLSRRATLTLNLVQINGQSTEADRRRDKVNVKTTILSKTSTPNTAEDETTGLQAQRVSANERAHLVAEFDRHNCHI